jgi:hypothetical protein
MYIFQIPNISIFEIVRFNSICTIVKKEKLDWGNPDITFCVIRTQFNAPARPVKDLRVSRRQGDREIATKLSLTVGNLALEAVLKLFRAE